MLLFPLFWGLYHVQLTSALVSPFFGFQRCNHQLLFLTTPGGAASNCDPSENDHSTRNSDILQVPLPKETPFLTTMERRRRETERHLLADLSNGDDVIPEFKKLWFSERGPLVEEMMHKAENDIGHPKTWSDAEDMLTQLIKDDPTYLEPYVRLSKLYCLQGRFQESETICQQVLCLRPWHFVALQTMVVINVGNSNLQGVKTWDSNRLPAPSCYDQRKAWVKKAVKEANYRLEVSKARQDFVSPDTSGDEFDGIEKEGGLWQ